MIIKSSNIDPEYALDLSAFNSTDARVTSVYLIVTMAVQRNAYPLFRPETQLGAFLLTSEMNAV
jgi:hypothetical protein